MFLGDRHAVLAALRTMGGSVCGYARDGEHWASPGHRCDCKYGITDGRWPARTGGEQTGCCELRTLYMLASKMTDVEWQATSMRTGGILHSQLDVALYGPTVPANHIAHVLAQHRATGTPEVQLLLDALERQLVPSG